MESNKPFLFSAALILLLVTGGGLALLGVFDSKTGDPKPPAAAGETGSRDQDPGDPAPSGVPAGGQDRPEPIVPSAYTGETEAERRAAMDAPQVAGVVVDDANHALAGAEIALIRDLSQIRNQMSLGGIVRTTATLPDGRFSLDIGRHGSYVLQVAHPRFTTSYVFPIDPMQPETLRQTIRMSPGFAVRGKVAESEGFPVEGAVVTVFDLARSGTQGQPPPYAERTASSDAEGAFHLGHLTPGMKRIVVTKAGYAADGVNGYTVQETDANAELKFVLSRGFAIHGRVLDARTRLPIAGAEVASRPLSMLEDPAAPSRDYRAAASDGDESALAALRLEAAGQAARTAAFRERVLLNLSTKTDEQGAFVLDGLMEARYQLVASANGFQKHQGISASAGDRDVLLDLIPSARIEGRCIDAVTGRPVQQFELALSPTADAFVFPIQGRQSFDDPEGRFSFTDARAGDHFLLCRAAGYAGGVAGPYAVVPEGLVSDVVVRMERGATVKGRVVDSGGGPVGRAEVVLLRRSSEVTDPGARVFMDLINSQVRSSASTRATTDDGGGWKIEGVFGGLYELRVERSGYSPATSSEFTCENSGECTAPTVVLEKGASIYGRILTPANEPDAQATVLITGLAGSPPFSTSAQTDRNGIFRVTGLAPGSYRLVQVQAAGQFDLFAVLKSREDNTNIATVAPGEDLEVHVRPSGGGR